jgi:hypothetical protein
MRDFLIQCLNDQESINGIRQLFYLQSDAVDGKRKVEVLIKGMLLTCKEFEYIPEERQKSIIASQMRQDMEYDALNSRTLWKWLNAFKSPYLNPHKLQDKEFDLPPLKPETEKMVREWQMTLLDKPGPRNVEFEMAKIKAEDAARMKGEQKPVSESAHYKPDPERLRFQELKAQYGRECCDLYTGRVKEGSPSFEEWVEALR